MSLDPYDVPDDERPASAAMILEEDRGALPYHLVHGEALVAAAAWAAGEAGLELVDLTTGWEAVAGWEVPLVLHDPLCPMTPPDFIAACAARAAADGVAVVGVRPVTDTVKVVTDGVLGDTVDRDGLAAVCSPVVLPTAAVAAVAAAGGLPSTDFVALVAWLRERYDVALVEAPPSARRVAGDDDLRVLEALTEPR